MPTTSARPPRWPPCQVSVPTWACAPMWLATWVWDLAWVSACPTCAPPASMPTTMNWWLPMWPWIMLLPPFLGTDPVLATVPDPDAPPLRRTICVTAATTDPPPRLRHRRRHIRTLTPIRIRTTAMAMRRSHPASRPLRHQLRFIIASYSSIIPAAMQS